MPEIDNKFTPETHVFLTYEEIIAKIREDVYCPPPKEKAEPREIPQNLFDFWDEEKVE